MNLIRRIWRRLTCQHRFEWQRNYYGDVITLSGGKRSLWFCSKCGAHEERATLGP